MKMSRWVSGKVDSVGKVVLSLFLRELTSRGRTSSHSSSQLTVEEL